MRLITPAARHSRAGNRATAERWQAHLRDAGYRVSTAERYENGPADVLIALHAWRSADSARAWRTRHPERPLIVVLTGTDLYRFQHSHPEPTRQVLHAADALIGLHGRVADDLPAALHGRLHTVIQSARPPPGRRAPLKTAFEACVVGHLREEKDSLRAARAARGLPDASRIRIHQFGKAHDGEWAAAAEAEMARNPRYRWYGEVPRWRVRQVMARARVMVMSSRMEGGANAVSEACVAGLPVIASRIPGNVGLLGEGYDGYYPVEDTDALRERLLRAERDPDWLEHLRGQVLHQSVSMTPAAEQAALTAVVRQTLQGARTPAVEPETT